MLTLPGSDAAEDNNFPAESTLVEMNDKDDSDAHRHGPQTPKGGVGDDVHESFTHDIDVGDDSVSVSENPIIMANGQASPARASGSRYRYTHLPRLLALMSAYPCGVLRFLYES